MSWSPVLVTEPSKSSTSSLMWSPAFFSAMDGSYKASNANAASASTEALHPTVWTDSWVAEPSWPEIHPSDNGQAGSFSGGAGLFTVSMSTNGIASRTGSAFPLRAGVWEDATVSVSYTGLTVTHGYDSNGTIRQGYLTLEYSLDGLTWVNLHTWNSAGTSTTIGVDPADIVNQSGTITTPSLGPITTMTAPKFRVTGKRSDSFGLSGAWGVCSITLTDFKIEGQIAARGSQAITYPTDANGHHYYYMGARENTVGLTVNFLITQRQVNSGYVTVINPATPVPEQGLTGILTGPNGFSFAFNGNGPVDGSGVTTVLPVSGYANGSLFFANAPHGIYTLTINPAYDYIGGSDLKTLTIVDILGATSVVNPDSQVWTAEFSVYGDYSVDVQYNWNIAHPGLNHPDDVLPFFP